MTTALLNAVPTPAEVAPQLTSHVAQMEADLGGEFLLLDRQTGERLAMSSCQSATSDYFEELVGLVDDSGRAAVIAEELPLLLLAIPLPAHQARELVAVGLFTTAVQAEYSAPRIANLLQCTPEQLQRNLIEHHSWNQRSLLRTAELIGRNLALQARVEELEQEVEQVSEHLSGTYEEISLLYGITQNLRISSGELELGVLALEWLSECIPAQAVAAVYLPVEGGDDLTYEARLQAEMKVAGDCPLELSQILAMVEELGLTSLSQPYVGNHLTSSVDWQHPEVENLILTPLSEGKNLFGWLAAVNHREEGFEFGTVEAALMNSVAVILGTHGGNIDLYRQHKEFLASVVRAMTSAIDAKDPYTCGHSDRVARVSVRLAQELGCSEELLNTIYMAGLVHDIGKIGIDDQVLRKPGRLTNDEFEQVKMHPELGHKILADIEQFHDVLPIVLHHHEQWDGKGYPHGLAGEAIPYLARICAVADAYDAMSSDRPYRRGMPDEKVDAIFRSGAGQQWDHQVVDAFFSARNDIREISRDERANLTLDVQQWARPPAPSYE